MVKTTCEFCEEKIYFFRNGVPLCTTHYIQEVNNNTEQTNKCEHCEKEGLFKYVNVLSPDNDKFLCGKHFEEALKNSVN